MKIAILSPFYPFRGGLSQLNTNLYKNLKKKGYDVRAFNFTTLYPEFLFPGKTQFVEEDDLRDDCSSTRILSTVNPLTYIKTAREINKYQPDILIIPYWMSFLAPSFGTVTFFLNKKIKIVSLVHNALPHERRFFDVPFAKYFFRKCDGFIVMSDFVEKELSSIVPSSNIINIEHPIYEQYTQQLTRKEACSTLDVDNNKNNILFFGLIREYKGLDLLIEAMNYLDDSYQLIVAGESYVDFSKYQELIDKSEFKDNIKVFQQYIPDDQVSTFFSASDLLVLPYRSATQSGVLALAYQLDKPMVSTNVGALGSSISKAKTGIVVDEITPQSISEGIQLFFKGGGREKYLENIKIEKERLSWSSFTQRLINFLHDKILS